MQTPEWLEWLSIVSLICAALCSLVIIIDISWGFKQKIWIMNRVWPVTALYTGPVALYAYFTIGRLSNHQAIKAKKEGKESPVKKKSFWQKTALAATHCGSGCTLADIIIEWILFFAPFTLFGKKIFGAWLFDYIAALLFGIAFQYFTIQPMKNLSVKKGIQQAFKVDVLSLTAWQVGMYGWMAIAKFAILCMN